jgi:hypothetical protein
VLSCIALCLINHIDYTIAIKQNDSQTKLEDFKNLNKFVNTLVEKLEKSIELFDKVSEETIDSNEVLTTSATYTSEEHLSAINFLQSVFSWLGYYMMKSFQPINSDILRLVPQVCT